MPRVGEVFGKLTVIRPNLKENNRGKRYNECLCICGRLIKVTTTDLLKVKNPRRICSRSHGLSRTSTYATWLGMIRRCANPSHRAYKDYGGRGIFVCEQWKESYETFLQDMGEKPNKDYSLDRINNNDGYYLENCRWATKIQQANNTRSNNILIFNRRALSVAQWAREFDISHSALDSRIRRGWDIEKALTTPVGFRLRNH